MERIDIVFEHQRKFTQNDMWDLDVFGSKWKTSYVNYGAGKSPYQGYSNRCAAEAINNVAESMSLPKLDAQKIYKEAKAIDNSPDHLAGTDLHCVAEIYCRHVPNVEWMILPSAEYTAKWINCKSAVALSMLWTDIDRTPGFGKILETGGIAMGGHAVSLYGFNPNYEWRRFPIFGKKYRSPVFLAENSNSPFPLVNITYSRVDKDFIEAVVLIPKK